MTKEEAFIEINKTQDDYVNQLINYINDPATAALKEINFTSATGTGKTKMMAKFINRFPSYYFIVTTLSRGQLKNQVKQNLINDCKYSNFTVYGLQDYTSVSRLTAEEILNKIPENTKVFWLRDEGHINTNNYMKLLENRCDKIINFSATNQRGIGILCNFTHTMMLRTVNQQTGTPEDAINKLLEIKRQHIFVKAYNPCAIFRLIRGDNKLYNHIIELCEQNHLQYIDLNENDYRMAELCEDNNPYDVIINKFKIIEGIDIRRAHILYMDSQPKNDATTIQVIGRCRRNALLYRNDIDILAPENKQLLKDTRECYVFYNVEKMNISTDETGELCYAFCPYISCERLKPEATIEVENGQLLNGLYVYELMGQTGTFTIKKDKTTGFNVTNPISDYYREEIREYNPTQYIYCSSRTDNVNYVKILAGNLLDIFRKENSKCLNINNTIVTKYKSYFNFINKEDYDLNPDLHSFEFINNEVYLKKFKPTQYVYISYALFRYKKISIPDLYNIYKINKYINIYRTQQDDRYKSYFEQTSEKQYKESHDRYTSTRSLILLNTVQKKGSAYIYVLDDGTKEYGKISLNNLRDIFTTNKDCSGINIKEYKNNANYKRFFESVTKEEYTLHHTKNIVDYIWKGLLKNIITNKESINGLEQYLYYSYKSIIYKRIHAKDLYNIGTNDNTLCYININDIKDDENYNDYFHIISEEEYNKNHNIKSSFAENELKQLLQQSEQAKYIYINNNLEIAIIGTDTFKVVKNNNDVKWIEDRTITSNIRTYSKLNRYITAKYRNELDSVKNDLFTGKPKFSFNRKCNSMLGYCVEYYSKYIVYGKDYLSSYISQAINESKSNSKHDQQFIIKNNLQDKIHLLNEASNEIVIRACILKYKNEIAMCYGQTISEKITTTSVFQLMQSNYKDFINTVVALGIKTANFVKKALYQNNPVKNIICPILQAKHIAGLADYITEDTILDIKVTNTIDETYIKQVLAYHYMSTMRSDLHIKRVIVYDAVSGKSVTVNITPKNLTSESTYKMLAEAEELHRLEEARKLEESKSNLD